MRTNVRCTINSNAFHRGRPGKFLRTNQVIHWRPLSTRENDKSARVCQAKYTAMMGMDGAMGASGALSPEGVDFSNETQAADFLGAILDDDELKIIGDAYARYFWYGIIVVVGIATIINVTRFTTLRVR